MLKVKAAYFIRQTPSLIAVAMPDGMVFVTERDPIRAIKEDELRVLPAITSGFWDVSKNGKELPLSQYVFYGLKKEEAAE